MQPRDDARLVGPGGISLGAGTRTSERPQKAKEGTNGRGVGLETGQVREEGLGARSGRGSHGEERERTAKWNDGKLSTPSDW